MEILAKIIKNNPKTSSFLILLFGILIRYGVGLGGYSGYKRRINRISQSTPPLFGDFEAQRHWMEITTSTPLSQWYTIDPRYWPLDYPPLSAYHAYIGIFRVGFTFIFDSLYYSLL